MDEVKAMVEELKALFAAAVGLLKDVWGIFAQVLKVVKSLFVAVLGLLKGLFGVFNRK